MVECGKRCDKCDVRPSTRESIANQGSGHDGICNLGWRIGGDSHPGNHHVPSENSRAVERHSKRHQWPVRRQGQSTIEYALVTAGFLALLTGTGVLMHYIAEGRLASLVVESLTHRLPWGVIDVGLF